MDDSQRALRHAAAEAFSQSLAHLAVCFEPEAVSSVSSVDLNAASAETPAPLQALEAAAADIEQLFRQTDD